MSVTVTTSPIGIDSMRFARIRLPRTKSISMTRALSSMSRMHSFDFTILDRPEAKANRICECPALENT